MANSWRTGADICSYWSTDNTVNPYCHGVADIIQNNEQYSRYSAPFGWNDPCFLVTGKTPYLFFLQMAETRPQYPLSWRPQCKPRLVKVASKGRGIMWPFGSQAAKR